MGKSAERRDELLNIMDARYEALPDSKKQEISFGREQEIPQWLKIQRSIREQMIARNDETRLERPMLESDPVIKFLSEMKNKVAKLVSQRWKEANGEDVDSDGGQISSETEIKENFIDYLESFISKRNLDKFNMFGDDDRNLYSASSEFQSLEELYDFLEKLSGESDDTITDFILNSLPSSYFFARHTRLRR